MDKKEIKEIIGGNESKGLGRMWRRQGGIQLTQHTKMQQAVTETKPVKINNINQHKTITTGRK